MPRYEVRLESPDLLRDDGTPHYRTTRLTADDANAARRICERKEFRLCAYDSDQINDLEKRVAKADGNIKAALQAKDRATYFAHHQRKPYDVVSVTEIKER